MFNHEKIFTVYEKPESAEPTDRVVLLREGFAWGAFIFGVLWLALHRRWLLLAGYILADGALMLLAAALHLSQPVSMLLQIWLQLMLAYHANDAYGWWLLRRGYRFAGVLAAESEMYAARRYYEFAA